MLENIGTAFITAIFFILLSLPILYKVVSGSECPNAWSHVLHMFVFIMLVGIILTIINLMKNRYVRKPFNNIILCAITYGLIFYLLSNNEIYTITDKLPYIQTIDGAGCPTYIGIFLHSIVCLISVFLFKLLR